MKFKAVCALILIATVFSIFGTDVRSTYAANPVSSSESAGIFDLAIPALKLDVPLIKAHFTGHTWDFSEFTQQAGYFEGLPLPGQKGNTIIGAHSELAERKPGPFFTLNEIKVGDKIIITQDTHKFIYTVTETWLVKPSDTSPLEQTDKETLTLLTCAGYNDGIYTTRLVVRAVRVID